MGLASDPSGLSSSRSGGRRRDDGRDSAFLTGAGEGFTLTAANLATLNGGTALTDSSHTIALQATDNLGNQPAFNVFFILQSTRPLPPTGVQLLASDLTGTSETITKDRTLTVEMSRRLARS